MGHQLNFASDSDKIKNYSSLKEITSINVVENEYIFPVKHILILQ